MAALAEGYSCLLHMRLNYFMLACNKNDHGALIGVNTAYYLSQTQGGNTH